MAGILVFHCCSNNGIKDVQDLSAELYKYWWKKAKKDNTMSYLNHYVVYKSNLSLTDQNQSVSKVFLRSGCPRGESTSLFFSSLRGTHISWLLVPFLHLQSQQDLHFPSLFIPNFIPSESPLLLPSFTFKVTCDHNEPILIVQDKLPILKSED
jgi:hypothetical protein